ncbi:alpha/beta hydrolase family protein [Rubrivirga sp. IMCC45206]|uniref:alpha/beta hydrolase family protein n=1 Tax=Rubrivirga sp. IMCC45206 TaxID=3391614 RepID=UPI00398FF6EA
MLRRLALSVLLALAPALAVAQPVALAVESGGVALPATLTRAADADGPRPLAVYLHGNPGRPLDQPPGRVDSLVTAALVAAGVDVVRVTYRGLWGTGGAFTLAHAVGDLDAVLDVVTAPAFADRLGHRPSAVVLVGYSFGTAAALVGASGDDRVDGVAALAPCDHGYFGGEFSDPDSKIRGFLDRVTASLFGEGGPVEGGGPAFIGDLSENADAYRFPAHAEGLLGTRLLLLGGLDDAVCYAEDHLVPLYRRLRALEHPALQAHVLPMDHGFGGVGPDALMAMVTEWIASGAGPAGDAPED